MSFNDAVLVATKASFRPGEDQTDADTSRYHLIRAVEASLRRLDTDHIDLFQLHGFDALAPVNETHGTLDDLVRALKIRRNALPSKESMLKSKTSNDTDPQVCN